MYNFCLLMRSGEQIFHSGIDFKNLIGIQAFLFCLFIKFLRMSSAIMVEKSTTVSF